MTLESILNNAKEHPEHTAGIIKKWLESIEPEYIEVCNLIEENAQKYTGPEKSAFIMLTFNKNEDIANEIFSRLSKGELKKLTRELEKLEKIDIKQQIAILRDFKEKMEAKRSRKKGGADSVRKILGTGKPEQ